MDEGIDLFSTRLNRIGEQLKAIKQPISEIYLTFQLIRYLPEEFDSIVQSILRWENKKFKYNDVVIELIAEEARIHVRDQDRRSNWNFEVQQIHKKRIQCRKCLRFGHIQKVCRSSPLVKTARLKDGSPPSSVSSPNSQEEQYFNKNNRRGRSPEKRMTRRARRGMNRSTSSSDSYRSDKFSLFTQASVTNSSWSKNGWIFDSAASHHFCKDRSLFIDYRPLTENLSVAVEGITIPIEGTGTIKLRFGEHTYRFTDVMYSPRLRRNLISGPQLDIKGAKFSGGRGKVKVSRNSQTLFTAVLENGMYYLYPRVPDKIQKKVRFEASPTHTSEMVKWHRRFAHISPDLIENTSKQNCVRGLPRVKKGGFECETCRINKQKRVSFKSVKDIRSKGPLELLVMDVWGPAKVIGRKGEKYFLSVIDEYSRKAAIYPMTHKSDAFKIFKLHLTRAERFLGKKVKAIKTDNGKEFDNDHFKNFCEEQGIKPEFTNIYSPEQNGISERFNQTVLNGVRSILSESKLHRNFWPEAALYFTYTWNRICHKNQTKTPLELYGGFPPSVSHLKPFGTTAYVGVAKQLRSKFDARAKKGILIGYAFRTKGYRIWIPEEEKIIETINVSFREQNPDRENSSGAVMGTNPQCSDSNSDSYETNYRNTFDCDSDENSESAIDEDSESQHTVEPDYELSETSSSDEEFKSSREVINTTPLRSAVWLRKAVPRSDGSRTDIYYYEEKKTERMRSLRDVEKYCDKHHIKFEPAIFDFKGSNNFQGRVMSQQNSDDSEINTSHTENTPNA